MCPKGRNDGEQCHISINHYRQRKTGPCFPIAVVGCYKHDFYFTLYPPGHLPYGRQPLMANLSVDGNSVTFESDSMHGSENKLNSFKDSLFDAVLDAYHSKIWSKESTTGSMEPRFNTQLRKLDWASRLLGVHDALDIKQSEEIIQILNLKGQMIAESLSELKHQATAKKQGQVICQLLMMLPQTLSLFERLTEAGSVALLWPTPFFWNHVTGRLRSSSFQWPGIRGSP